MSVSEIEDLSGDTRFSLRNEPMQARSAARLTALLDATAAIIDEIGYERLTTAMVAERAGASIGTVYRYFPDRIALLQALGVRNFERVSDRVAHAVADSQHTDWKGALAAGYEVLAGAFLTEPGFRSLRMGDQLDLRPAGQEPRYKTVIADRMLTELLVRFDVEDSEELRFAFEATIELSDSLAARAFATDDVDARYLELARDLTYSVLREYFGDGE